MSPIISVVIPVYNAEKALGKTLESIIQQKYFEKSEIVLVDDGSTDSSYEICKKYEKRCRNITIQHIENSGVSRARNIGKSIARGEYIWFVDADDYISDDAFEKLYEIICNYKYDVVFFDNYFEQPDGTVLCHPIKNIKEKVEYDQIKIRNIIIPWILGYTDNQSDVFSYAKQTGVVTYSDCYNAPWQALYRHKFIDQIFFDESLKIYEDLLFNFEVLLSAASLYYVAEPLYHYVNNANGLATKYHRDYAEMKLYLYHKMACMMEQFGISGDVLKLIGYRIQNDFVSIFINETKNKNNDAIKIIKKFFADSLVKKSFLLQGKKKFSYRVLFWLVRHKCYAAVLWIVSIRVGGIK